MNTSVYATRNEKRSILLPKCDTAYIIGIDLGYSSAKVITETAAYCFTNAFKKLFGNIVGEMNDMDMIYTSSEGDRYFAGRMALNALKEDDVISDEQLYGRNHYMSPEFLIQLRTALALALWDKKTDDPRPIFIQTGLPPAYLHVDEKKLRAVIEGTHEFSLTYGKETRFFKFHITRDMVDVMMQPMGTYYSISIDNAGKPINLKKYLSSNTLIVDGGFKTFDIYGVAAREVVAKSTGDKLGMYHVLLETKRLIQEDYPETDFTVPMLQRALTTGVLPYIDLLTMTSENIPIDSYFDRANHRIAEEAFKLITPLIAGMNNLVMTGGTGAAWMYIFEQKLKNLSSLTLIPGNDLSGLAYIYANARGYYLARYVSLKYGIAV